MAEPAHLPATSDHPNLIRLEPLESDGGTRWLCAREPAMPSLGELWVAGDLPESELLACWLHVVEALVHIAATRPDLLPRELHHDHIRQVGQGAWVLDLPGLALAPGMEFGSSVNVIKAVGTALRLFLGEEIAPEGGTPAARQYSPALRFIMMRCMFGGFASLTEVHQALKELGTPGSGTVPFSNRDQVSKAEGPVLPEAQRQPAEPVLLPVRPPQGRRSRWPSLVGASLFVGALVVSGFVWSNAQPEEISAAQPVPAEEPRPQRVATVIVVVPESGAWEPPVDDYLKIERRYQPSPAEKPAEPPPPPPKPVAKPAPPAPAPEPAEPTDPQMRLDWKTAGGSPVTVTLWGKTVGQAYMFTNPGAPVMSMETFSRLLGRPLVGELRGAKELQITSQGRTFVTSHFIIPDDRVWLILTPELMDQLGLRVVQYGSGSLDLEPKL